MSFGLPPFIFLPILANYTLTAESDKNGFGGVIFIPLDFDGFILTASISRRLFFAVFHPLFRRNAPLICRIMEEKGEVL